MAELAETHQHNHDALLRPPALDSTADSRPGLPTPWSGHTNALNSTLTNTYETIDQTFH